MVVQHSVRRWFQHVSTILPMPTGWLLLGKWHAAFGFLCRRPLGFHCCVPSSAIFHWCCKNWIGSCWQVALDKVHSTTLGYRSLALSKCSLKKVQYRMMVRPKPGSVQQNAPRAAATARSCVNHDVAVQSVQSYNQRRWKKWVLWDKNEIGLYGQSGGCKYVLWVFKGNPTIRSSTLRIYLQWNSSFWFARFKSSRVALL